MELLCGTVIDFLVSYHYSSTNVLDHRISIIQESLTKLEKNFSCQRVDII